MQTLTTAPAIQSIRSVCHPTWFDIGEEREYGNLTLETREHGDTYEEEPGQKDIVEGKRLLAAIRDTWPASAWKSSLSIVDEWVSVTIRVAPFSTHELAAVQTQQRFDELALTIDSTISEAN